MRFYSEQDMYERSRQVHVWIEINLMNNLMNKKIISTIYIYILIVEICIIIFYICMFKYVKLL